MNELVDSPFGRSAVTETVGSRQLQARENTEVMAMAAMAKRFPRNEIAACDRIRNAFTRVTLAEKAQYQFARGGTDIVGPSIRAAEAIAQSWGNLTHGWREVSRVIGDDGVGVSEIEAYCVDYESVTRDAIQFPVRHWRDTKKGGYAIKDERDIYELCANQASRRKRACILALIPGDVTEMAMDQASVTLKTSADVSPEAMAKLVGAFAEFKVTKAMIETRIQRRLDAIQPAQVVGLRRVYASLRDEMSSVVDWFPEVAEGTTGIDAVRQAAATAKKPPASPAVKKPAPEKVHQAPVATTDPDTGEILAGEPESVPVNEAAIAARLQAMSDIEMLDLAGDELRGLPEGPRERMQDIYRVRREALAT